MTATATKQFVIELASDFLDLKSGESRVDTQKCVIRGVRVLGLESRNTGRVLGLTEEEFGKAVDLPYRYSMEAVRAAKPLYENATVYSNHLKFEVDDDGKRVFKQNVRENEEMIGWLQNVRAVEGKGLFADLHYIESHPMSKAMVEIAQRNPSKLALSHEAGFDNPQLRNGRIELMEITTVDGVALVNSKPGTTNGLFEDSVTGLLKAIESVNGEIVPDVPMDQPMAPAQPEQQGNEVRVSLLKSIMDKLDKSDVDQLKKVLDSIGMSDSISETVSGKPLTVAPSDTEEVPAPELTEKPDGEVAPGEDAAHEKPEGEVKPEDEEEDKDEVLECQDMTAEQAKKNCEDAAKAMKDLILECLGHLKAVGASANPVIIEAMTKLDTPEARKQLAEQFSVSAQVAIESTVTKERPVEGQPTGKKVTEQAVSFEEPGSLVKAMSLR